MTNGDNIDFARNLTERKIYLYYKVHKTFIFIVSSVSVQNINFTYIRCNSPKIKFVSRSELKEIVRASSTGKHLWWNGRKVGPNRRNAFAWPHTFHGNPDRIRRTVGERNVSRIFPSRSADPVPLWRQPVFSVFLCSSCPFEPFPQPFSSFCRPAPVVGSGSITIFSIKQEKEYKS